MEENYFLKRHLELYSETQTKIVNECLPIICELVDDEIQIYQVLLNISTREMYFLKEFATNNDSMHYQNPHSKMIDLISNIKFEKPTRDFRNELAENIIKNNDSIDAKNILLQYGFSNQSSNNKISKNKNLLNVNNLLDYNEPVNIFDEMKRYNESCLEYDRLIAVCLKNGKIVGSADVCYGNGKSIDIADMECHELHHLAKIYDVDETLLVYNNATSRNINHNEDTKIFNKVVERMKKVNIDVNDYLVYTNDSVYSTVEQKKYFKDDTVNCFKTKIKNKM